MSKVCGRDFIVEVNHPTLGWVTIPGVQDDSADSSRETVDTTDKQNAPFRELHNCGIRGVTLSSSGVARRQEITPEDPTGDAVWNYLIQVNSFNEYIELRVRSNVDIFYEWHRGMYLCSNLSRSGSHNNAESWTVTFESATALSYNNLPQFDAVPPTKFAHGWSVRRLRAGFSEAGPLVAYRVNDGATATIPWDSSGDYADVNWLTTWLNGSEGLLTYAFDQASVGTLPNGNPEPLMDLEQLDVNEMPRLSDANGNVYTNSAGILEIEFQRAGESFGQDRYLVSNQRDYGPPAGAVDVVFANYAGRSTVTGLTKRAFTQGPGAWNLGSRYIPSKGNGWEWSPDGADVELFSGDDVTQPHVATGAVSDTTPKALMVNGKFTTLPASPQSWGLSRVYWGRASNAANTTWIGFMQEAWSYYEDPNLVTPAYFTDTVALIQQNVANSLGYSI